MRPPSRRILVWEDAEPAPRPACTVLPRRGGVEHTWAWWGAKSAAQQRVGTLMGAQYSEALCGAESFNGPTPRGCLSFSDSF